MFWDRGRRSSNIEDQRGMAGGFGTGARRGGIGGLGLLLLVLVGLLFGVNPLALLGLMPDTGSVGPSPSAPPAQQSTKDQRAAEFVSVVLADTEDVWREQFQRLGRVYQEPKLVLYSGVVRSACGMAESAAGPFYCPADRKVYLDTAFFDEMRQRFGAPGDFAQAYVIAHEVGHHVQNLLGIAPRVEALRRQVGPADGNRLSVMMELQADCLAGVWANNAQRARQILEQGDIEEGLNAASAIGDDRLQRQSQGYVVPDAFTHGSSQQRVYWFKRGLSAGDMGACDTFSAG